MLFRSPVPVFAVSELWATLTESKRVWDFGGLGLRLWDFGGLGFRRSDLGFGVWGLGSSRLGAQGDPGHTREIPASSREAGALALTIE